MSETNNKTTSDESPRTDKKDELSLADPLVESSVVNTTPVHIPGMALETRSDREARESFEAEKADHADPETPTPEEYQAGGSDTRTPRANLLTRSNIVPAGPGSAGDEPAIPLPGLPAEDQVAAPSRNGVTVIEDRDSDKRSNRKAR